MAKESIKNKELRMRGIKENNKIVKEKKEKDVKDAIDRLRATGEDFTLAMLCREANVSRTYFSKHPEMRKLADEYIVPTGFCRNRSKDTTNTLIKILKEENQNLKNALKASLTNIKDFEGKDRSEMDFDEKEIYLKVLEKENKSLKKEIDVLRSEYKDCVPAEMYNELMDEKENLKKENENLQAIYESSKNSSQPKDSIELAKYKERYEKANEEIKKLKDQLEAAYALVLPDHL